MSCQYSMIGKLAHGVTVVQQALDEVGHVEADAVGDEVVGCGFEQVDAGVDEERQRRLLPQLRHTHVVALHHAERHVDLVFAHAHREVGPVRRW